MGLNQYTLLGSSGLRVSRLALGGMTFGTPWTGNLAKGAQSWGMDERTVREVLAAYVDAGGNFIDTADHYGQGASETMIGKFVAETGLRDRLVIGTKFGFSGEPGNPNAGGSGRKNILRSLEGSLRRLGCDYVDLLILHAWDGMTSADEVLRTLDDLVRAGKVRHIGLSNVPVRFAARFQTVAELRGLEPSCSMQIEYSLLERNAELEHIPLCMETGMGVTLWSPLASGMLTGKYRRDGKGGVGDGRLAQTPGMAKFSERNWGIVESLESVAKEMGRSMAQVALNWALNRPGISSVIIGVSGLQQLQDNLAALEFGIPPPLSKRLDDVSAPRLHYPYSYLARTAEMVLGADVKRA